MVGQPWEEEVGGKPVFFWTTTVLVSNECRMGRISVSPQSESGLDHSQSLDSTALATIHNWPRCVERVVAEDDVSSWSWVAGADVVLGSGFGAYSAGAGADTGGFWHKH